MTTDSSQRIEPGSVNHLPAPWPASTQNETVDASSIATDIISSFNEALSSNNYDAIAELFAEQGYWRDHLTSSWRLRTLKGRDKIRSFLQEQCHLTKLDIDTSSPARAPKVGGFRPQGDKTGFTGVTSVGISFYVNANTEYGTARGFVRLADYNGTWKIWVLFTTLQELAGHEEPRSDRRPRGVNHGYNPNRKNWVERRQEEVDFVNAEPDVLIIGAGQSGLSAHARLKMLNVPTLIIDRHDAVGDNWRKRYRQLVLHDPVWYDHMPYMPFPDFWPIFTPKDKLADWFESYAKALELNIWMKSELQSSSWDDAKKQWTVTIKRTRPDGQIETRTLHPKHIIQATGGSGKKHMPSVPGMDSFKGHLLCHSSEFPGAREGVGKGKKAIVVGACNSSHDICQDYYEKGYDVTMVQRSSTCVVSSEACLKLLLGGAYEEHSGPVEDSDIALHSMPAEVLKAIQVDLTNIQSAFDGELLEGLNKVGFKTDKGIDGAGLFAKYLQRHGGYYIDVGMSQLIVEGKVRVKHGQEIAEVLPNGLKFADGTVLEADEIVFATGYENMRTEARHIFGDELADKVNDIWGWNEEGEFRSIWTDSGHPGFWFHGGNLALGRYYSKVLALQIKARLEGLGK